MRGYTLKKNWYIKKIVPEGAIPDDSKSQMWMREKIFKSFIQKLLFFMSIDREVILADE